MDIVFWFWILIAFILGRISASQSFYIGTDEEKYKKATAAILMRKDHAK